MKKDALLEQLRSDLISIENALDSQSYCWPYDGSAYNAQQISSEILRITTRMIKDIENNGTKK
jgi:hypothetical protein